MSTRGFTTIELVIAVVIIGTIAMIGFPRIKDAVEKQNRRAMRAALVSYMALARNSAVARGCRAAVHFVSGSNSRVWVTACSVRAGAPAGSRDTLAGPEWTEERWGHRFYAIGRDSINYDSRGLRQSLVSTTIKIRTKGEVERDSVVVNALGKVIYP
jgi:prepilin-type N-terminal cleavage/methylation domain-containing protein